MLEEDYSHDKDVVIAKVVAGLGLFIVSTICGVIPFKLAKIYNWSEPIDPSSKSKKKSAKIVSILLCFGGGVLLATTFLHLLPDINGEIAILIAEGKIPELHLALGELLMLLGFFVIYLIEEIVHYYLHRYQAKLKSKSKTSVATMKPDEETYAEALMRGITARNSVHRRFSDVSCMNPVSCINPAHSHSRRGSTHDLSNNLTTKTLSTTEKGQIEMSVSVIERNHTHSHHNHSHENGADKGHGHGHSHALPIPHSDDEDMLVSSLRGLLIVLALSIHELFEGFAVGLQKTESGVYYMFAAVSAHKFVISFCIGVELMVQRTNMWLAFVYVFVYSFVSAFGE
jgi:zinc transporter 1/2/3